MQLKSILNRIEKVPGFVYERVSWDEKRNVIEVKIRARANSRPVCSGCGSIAVGYDRLRTRRFEFVPLWQIPVFFVYRMRRVNCGGCGIQVEAVPWAVGKNRATTTYLWFLAMWARRMSWQEVADVFRSSWQRVRGAVEHAVEWGRAHVDLRGVESIGVDEILHRRGSKTYGGPTYLTLVYQIDEHRKRLLWVGRDRREATLHGFFDWLGEEATAKLRVACTDMWRPYLKVIGQRAAGVLQILDRFHVMSAMNTALDRIRAIEVRELRKKQRHGVLTNTRWLFLKRSEHLSEPQHEKLSEILGQNLRIVRAYLLKESFQRFWQYLSPYAAGRFLDEWCTKAMRSRIEEMKKIATMMRNHRTILLNWFKAKGVSVGAVEGFNNKAKVAFRKSYGFRSYRAAELALYHSLGDLPHPNFAHTFW